MDNKKEKEENEWKTDEMWAVNRSIVSASTLQELNSLSFSKDLNQSKGQLGQDWKEENKHERQRMMIQQFETLMIDSWSNSSFPFSTSISSQEREWR